MSAELSVRTIGEAGDRKGGDAIRDLLAGGEGGGIFQASLPDWARPIAPPLPSPDPPVHIVLRIAKRIADWICNPM